MELKYPEERYKKFDKTIEREDAILAISDKYTYDSRIEVRTDIDFNYGRYIAYQDIINRCRNMQDDIVEALKDKAKDWGEPQND